MTEQQTNGRIAASDGAQGCAAAGTLRAEELAELTSAAQRGERQAIDRLCAAFAPLVKKEAHADAVYRALGEDAENAAWVLFLELIQKPGRQTGASYPGFLKKSLHLGLLKQVIRQSSLAEREVSGEKADALLEAGGGTGCGDIELRLSLQSALARLTDKQRGALLAAAVEGKNFAAVGADRNITAGNAYKLYQKALKNLRKNLQ